MGMKLDFKITGVTAFNRGWDRLISVLGDDLTRPLSEVQSWWYEVQRKVFASEGEHLHGAKWQALSDNYREWKEENYGDLPILYLTGKLSQAVRGVGTNSYVEKNKQSMRLGLSDIPYWAVHNWGSEPGKKQNIPQRQYAGIKKDDIKDLDRRIQRLLRKINKEIQAEFDKKYPNDGGKKTR